AVVVDDRDMAISHVIRAEEHLPTTPKAVLLWEALNTGGDAIELPVFAHLPVLVNDRRQKISKRRDRVALEDYEAIGFLPEAMDNYLSLLGWSPPDGEEFFSLEDLVREFRLESVNHSPAFFDDKKLLHFNGVYLRSLTVDDFTERVRRWAVQTGDPLGEDLYSSPTWQSLAPLVQERVAVLSEVPSYVEFIFGSRFEVDEASFDKAVARDELAGKILSQARERFAGLDGWDAAALKEQLEAVALQHDRKLGKAQAPVRVATLGRSVGLPLFESLEVLGREETLERIDAALARVG
ncbi:MAG: glutamate--tRNA ligase, partial [Acidimicrobiales bacterium]